jgi:hypothetical protein
LCEFLFFDNLSFFFLTFAVPKSGTPNVSAPTQVEQRGRREKNRGAAPTQVRPRGGREKKRGVGRLGRCGQFAFVKAPCSCHRQIHSHTPCLAGVPSASRKASRKTPISSPEISRCEHVSPAGSNSQMGATNTTNAIRRHDGPIRSFSPTGSADSRNSRSSRRGGDSSGGGRRAQGVMFKPPAAKMPTMASEELRQHYCSLGIGLDPHGTATGGQNGAHAWITGALEVFFHYVLASVLRRF